MKLVFSLAILSYAFGATHADGLRNGDQGKPPSFVEDGDLPPGLVDNPRYGRNRVDCTFVFKLRSNISLITDFFSLK